MAKRIRLRVVKRVVVFALTLVVVTPLIAGVQVRGGSSSASAHAAANQRLR